MPNDDTQPIKMPSKPFRVLWSGRTMYFDSKADRDEGAVKLARDTGETVLAEFWSPTNPQDHLNNGWACDLPVHPPAPEPSS